MIKVICVVDSFKHYEEPINEFLKRLGKSFEFIKLKPSKKRDIKEIIKEESKILKIEIDKLKGCKVLLDINGGEMSTEKLFNFVEDIENKYSNIIFVIAGSYGTDIDYLDNSIDFRLSLGQMTFPHILAILILLEQVYRITTLKKGSSYHH